MKVSCIYCGRQIKGPVKGRLATHEQLQHAAQYHYPHNVTNTYICDKHRRYPPIRGRTNSVSHSSNSSDSSSISEPSSKRQRTAEIISSLSQHAPQQQPPTATIAQEPHATASALPEPESSTSSSQSVVTTATSMSAPQQHTPPKRLSSDVLDISPHEQDHKFPLLDKQEFKRNGLPYNKSFEVRNSTVCSGLGLFTRPGVTIDPHMHIAYYGGDLLTANDVQERYGASKPRYVMSICDDRSRDARDDLASLGRYINTDPSRNNARIVARVGDSKAGRYSARFESTSRIGPSTEVLSAYGRSASRAARSHSASTSSSAQDALPQLHRLPAASESSLLRSSAHLPHTTSTSVLQDNSSHALSRASSTSTSPLI